MLDDWSRAALVQRVRVMQVIVLATWLPSVGRVEKWLERTAREVPGCGWD